MTSFRLPRWSTVLLLLLLVVTVSLEQAFALPVMTLMILFIQQPLLNELESCLLAGIIGIFFSVIFHMPIALGVAIVVLVVGLSRTVFQQSHVQVRDAILTLATCSAMTLAMQSRLSLIAVAEFIVYFLVIVVILRLWIRRRSYHAKRSKTSS